MGSLCTGRRINEKRNNELHFAGAQGLDSWINSLHKEGADVKTQNYSGDTPLVTAVKAEKTRFMEKLIDNGAELNIANSNDLTALNYAAGQSFGKTLRSKQTERKRKRFLLCFRLVWVGYIIGIHTVLPSEIAFTFAFAPMGPEVIK